MGKGSGDVFTSKGECGWDSSAMDCEFLIVNALTGERTLIEPPEQPPLNP